MANRKNVETVSVKDALVASLEAIADAIPSLEPVADSAAQESNPQTDIVDVDEPEEEEEETEKKEETILSESLLKDANGTEQPVKLIQVRATLTKRRGRPEKGKEKDTSPAPTKSADFERIEATDIAGIMPALFRAYQGNQVETLTAINALLEKKAYRVATTKAFKIDEMVRNFIKGMVEGGMAQEEAERRADIAFAGLRS